MRLRMYRKDMRLEVEGVYKLFVSSSFMSG